MGLGGLVLGQQGTNLLLGRDGEEPIPVLLGCCSIVVDVLLEKKILY